MGWFFRIKLNIRRFARRHSWLIAAIRSFMIFSAAFGGAYGFIAGSRAENSGYNPHAFAIGASFLFAIACVALATLSIPTVTRLADSITPGRTSAVPSPPSASGSTPVRVTIAASEMVMRLWCRRLELAGPRRTPGPT